jgi:hypothetical protein
MMMPYPYLKIKVLYLVFQDLIFLIKPPYKRLIKNKKYTRENKNKKFTRDQCHHH